MSQHKILECERSLFLLMSIQIRCKSSLTGSLIKDIISIQVRIIISRSKKMNLFVDFIATCSESEPQREFTHQVKNESKISSTGLMIIESDLLCFLYFNMTLNKILFIQLVLMAVGLNNFEILRFLNEFCIERKSEQ